MSLLADILTWSTNDLLPWQRDALRRLFQSQVISNPDLDELYAMMKSAHGILDPQNRQPNPLAQSHLPVRLNAGKTVKLKSMRDLNYVNRIADKQKLVFSENGMTVIYGGNGSGKSGYSRVLKKACRARDVLEQLHTDVRDPQAAQKIPSAVFDLLVGTDEKEVGWSRNTTPPDELSTIAVFDARCARSYLDEGDVAYLPYGLDIVESLGQTVLPSILQRLTKEIESINTDAAPFADLLGDTSVGKAISSLSAATDVQTIKSLASLLTEESGRLSQLDKSLSESDPKARAAEIRRAVQRVDGLVARIDRSVALVDDSVLQKMKSFDDEAETAAKAESAAAERFRAGEALLPGTGDGPWKDLFESARRFSIDSAYPAKEFPYTSVGAQCPLCQQPLKPDAANRMQRFEEFLKADTAKVASEKRRDRQNLMKGFSEAPLAFGLDKALSDELGQSDVSVSGNIQAFERKVVLRRNWALNAFTTHNWDNPPVPDDDPRPKLKALSKKFNDEAVVLDRAGDETQKAALQRERQELQSRNNLSLKLTSILDLIGRMKKKATLEKCKDDLKTKAISDKAKEFASQAVTDALKKGLDAEFLALGIAHVKTRLQERASKGKTKHKLLLDIPSVVKLDEILSEGEQRAIAIGSFLAELRLADHNGGIVFDDPVSSLDHHRRTKVVARLVEEAKLRQVVVFTHDTIFLCELIDELERQRVGFLVHHLEHRSDRPGYVSDGLPWEHQKYKERIDKLEKAQKALERSWPAYPSEEDRLRIMQEYDHLRATIERVVQDVVLNGVVRRHDSYIRVKELKGVVGFCEKEREKLTNLYNACHDAVAAHDPSSAKNTPPPDATQLGRDIASLRVIIDEINARKNAPSPVGVINPGAPSTQT